MSKPVIVEYLDHSIAIIGLPKEIKEEIKVLGGRPLWNLQHEGKLHFAWLLHRKDRELANQLIDACESGILPLKGVLNINTLLAKLSRANVGKSENIYKKIFSIRFKDIHLPNDVSFKEHSLENLVLFFLENLEELKFILIRELTIKSGAGNSQIKFDRRSKKAARIINNAAEIKNSIEEVIIRTIEPKFIKELRIAENPIELFLVQKFSVQCCV